jgi:hypothetical protein
MNSRKRSGQMRGRKPPFRPGNLPQNATVGGKPPFHTAPGFLVPQARVLIPPAEFTFWQKAYQKLLAETPIEQGAVTPFSSPVRLIELTTNINQVHMFHGHTYVEFEARRCNQNITIRIMFFFRGSILHVTAVEVYEPGKSYDTTQSLILLRSTITHANHSDCKIGQKADMSNSTFIKCCSGLDSCISFAHPLSLYEEQFIKTTWLHALEARDKLEAFEMPKDDKDHDGSDNKEGGIDPVGEKTLLTQIQSQMFVVSNSLPDWGS